MLLTIIHLVTLNSFGIAWNFRAASQLPELCRQHESFLRVAFHNDLDPPWHNAVNEFIDVFQVSFLL